MINIAIVTCTVVILTVLNDNAWPEYKVEYGEVCWDYTSADKD